MSCAVMGVLLSASTALHAQSAQQAPQANAAQIIPDAPKLSSEDANKGVGDFVKLIREYYADIKSNNTEKLMTEFMPKMQEWQQGAASWATSLSEEDQTTLQTYMMKVGELMQPEDAGEPVTEPVKE